MLPEPLQTGRWNGQGRMLVVRRATCTPRGGCDSTSASDPVARHQVAGCGKPQSAARQAAPTVSCGKPQSAARQAAPTYGWRSGLRRPRAAILRLDAWGQTSGWAYPHRARRLGGRPECIPHARLFQPLQPKGFFFLPLVARPEIQTVVQSG